MEVLTKEDLEIFRQELINELKTWLEQQKLQQKPWLKSSEVKKLLSMSDGTLQNLRVTGILKSVKIGGVHYYSYADIYEMMNRLKTTDGGGRK